MNIIALKADTAGCSQEPDKVKRLPNSIKQLDFLSKCVDSILTLSWSVDLHKIIKSQFYFHLQWAGVEFGKRWKHFLLFSTFTPASILQLRTQDIDSCWLLMTQRWETWSYDVKSNFLISFFSIRTKLVFKASRPENRLESSGQL